MKKIIVLGFGRMGKIHAQNLINNSQAELSGIVDQYLAGQDSGFGFPIAGDIQPFLEDENVNGVIVCSPTSTHFEAVSKCLRSRKSVLCEKPLFQQTEKCVELAFLAKQNQQTLITGFNRRYDDDVISIKNSITKNELGTIEHITLLSRDPEPPPHSYIERSGGLFLDMSIHDLDMSINLLPEYPTTLSVQASDIMDRTSGDYNNAIISLKTDSGATVCIHNNRRATYGYDQRIEVYGSKASLNLNNHFSNHLTRLDANGEHRSSLKHFFIERYQQSYVNLLQSFLDRIDQTLIDSGFEAVYLAEQAMISAKEHRLIQLDFSQFKYSEKV